MEKHKWGMIINIASMAGVTPAPALAAYSASKAGVVAHSESLRYELMLKKSPVSVHVVMPFIVTTAMNDVYLPAAIKDGNSPMFYSTTTEESADMIITQALRGKAKIFAPPTQGIIATIAK